jgi:hypothetical protein
MGRDVAILTSPSVICRNTIIDTHADNEIVQQACPGPNLGELDTSPMHLAIPNEPEDENEAEIGADADPLRCRGSEHKLHAMTIPHLIGTKLDAVRGCENG